MGTNGLYQPIFHFSFKRNFHPFNMFKSTLVCLVLALSVQGAVLPRNNGGDKKEVEYKTVYKTEYKDKPVYKTEYKTETETPKPEIKYSTKVEYKTKTPAPVTKYETKTVKADPIYVTPAPKTEYKTKYETKYETKYDTKYETKTVQAAPVTVTASPVTKTEYKTEYKTKTEEKKVYVTKKPDPTTVYKEGKTVTVTAKPKPVCKEHVEYYDEKKMKCL